jgi:electron transfer flavoprotein beta subunit
MNILVCIKQVPETNRVEVDPVTGVLKREGIDCKMNPYDLYALETALRLKEKYGGHVSVMTMGPAQAKDIIKEAYSMGADEGILISDRKFAGADVLATSYTLSQGITKVGGFDLILCGKQTTDGDTAQVGPEIAEWLNIPSVANVTKIIDVMSDSITVEMDLSNIIEVASILFPCLICVDKDIFEPRLPSFVKKMQTKDKEIKVLTLNDLDDNDESKYGLNGSPTQVMRIFPPDTANNRELWRGDSDGLANKIAQTLKERKFI